MAFSECNFQWEYFTVEEGTPLRLALDISGIYFIGLHFNPVGEHIFDVKL